MDDLISRQAAIESIKRNAYRHTYLDQIIDIIKDLPPSQSKKGKWTKDGVFSVYQFKCSECGCYHRAMYDFCPSCGAEMRGGER